jgi:hypothetical protein
LTAQGCVRETAAVPFRPAVAASVVAVLAALAPAALAAPPPTMTGEQFDSFGGPWAVPVPMTMDCTHNPDGTADVSWKTIPQPTTAGPYDGNFTERGQMHVGPTNPPYNIFRDIRSLSAEFTIESSVGQVSGTKRLTAPVADDAVVSCESNEFIVDTVSSPGSSLSLTYNATITTPEGVFADRGQASHYFSDEGPRALTELHEGFTSSLSATERKDSVLFGKRMPGGSWSAMSANAKRASPFTLYFPATVRKVHAFLDGGGATSGSQLVRAVLYRHAQGVPAGYVAKSFAFTVPAGMSPRWVEFYLAPPVQLQPGLYWLGLHSGATNGVARFAWDSKPGSRRFNIDAESDGPADPFGPAPVDDQQMAIFATGSY